MKTKKEDRMSKFIAVFLNALSFVVFAVGMICLLALATGCSSCKSSDPSPPQNVLAIGDSLTQGTTGIDSFVVLAGKDLNWTLDNKAQGGTISSQQLAVVKSLDLNKYSSVVYMPGFNDMRRFGMSDEFEQNLIQIMDILTQYHMTIYLGTTMRMIEAEYTDSSIGGGQYVYGSDQITIQYSDIIRSMVKRYPMSHIEIFDVNTQYTPTLDKVIDGVHGNAIAQQELKTILESVIVK